MAQGPLFNKAVFGVSTTTVQRDLGTHSDYLSYDYVTTEGFPDVFLGIIGDGLLLASLVIVPALLFDSD